MAKAHGFMSFISVVALLLNSLKVEAQTASISGKVISDGKSVPFANVYLKAVERGVSANVEGEFEIKDLDAGTYTIQISAIGYMALNEELSLENGEAFRKEFTLKEDVLNLSQVVVTGSRNQVERYNSPVIINTISAKTFESTQSVNLADGLNFSLGLRVENNCQNCGFTQLRMNGLDGAYSQVLINSRPVFSALAGVYGLEMLPANMVDRIEVVRGGGSVMYGGNAIAGTVNIITKDPIENTFEVGVNQSLINGEAGDRTVNFNASLVSEDLKKGISFFGFNRNRDHWDANGDGFSETVALKNTTFGFDAFFDLTDRDKLKFGAYYIKEFRRGGNKFELVPHQTDLTEQLEHDIVSTNLAFEHYSKDNKHKFSFYGSLQQLERASYYGGGGRVIVPGDSLTAEDILALNAYGNSEDLSTVSGLQYNYFINSMFSLTIGSEYIYNKVDDQMPGYGRLIDQKVGSWGTFAELEVKPTEKLTFLFGGRYDQLEINGTYDLQEEKFENNEDLNVLIPRLSAIYNIKENLKLRASYAQGYRGPQAFDEDLHIETVGGAARFIRLSPDLEVERSNSAVVSLNYDQFVGKKQMNFVIEGFYTQLTNPFIFSDQQELPSGVALLNKRNGDGAIVSGINLEANIAFGSKLVLQSGATFQNALYEVEEELWSPEVPSEEISATTTDRLLRTPNTYGYFSLVYSPTESLSFSYSGVYTGSMAVPHVIDVSTERTIIENTSSFFEQNIKLSYTIPVDEHYMLSIFAGIQNLTNSYQEDFDTGADRDAGYVYGPIRPRTFFMGLKFGFE
jgi:outer membrane receptor for ferrienterochelin and colicins